MNSHAKQKLRKFILKEQINS